MRKNSVFTPLKNLDEKETRLNNFNKKETKNER